MSTVTQPLKYKWTAYFDDGVVLEQPSDDRYSKHDDDSDWNPSAFRDLTDHQKKAKLIYFDLNDGNFAYGVELATGRFGINGTWFTLETDEPLTDRKLTYWRGVKQDYTQSADGLIIEGEREFDGYFFGYEGKDRSGKNVTKVIRID